MTKNNLIVNFLHNRVKNGKVDTLSIKGNKLYSKKFLIAKIFPKLSELDIYDNRKSLPKYVLADLWELKMVVKAIRILLGD
jgi:hypothetical protein